MTEMSEYGNVQYLAKTAQHNSTVVGVISNVTSPDS